MSAVVVDASVVVKWFFPEVHGDEALHIRRTAGSFVVPDLLYAEVGNVLWHRVKTGAITLEEAHTVAAALGALPLSSGPVPSAELLASALEIACQTSSTVYDSLYLALALRDGTSCITADRKFYDRLQATPFAPHVAWINDSLPALV
ncbi:MAG: PilT protein [Chthonomonadaceae bacterium]|nr:PilT protein [Chthonomonadaceae bacterium]